MTPRHYQTCSMDIQDCVLQASRGHSKGYLSCSIDLLQKSWFDLQIRVLQNSNQTHPQPKPPMPIHFLQHPEHLLDPTPAPDGLGSLLDPDTSTFLILTMHLASRITSGLGRFFGMLNQMLGHIRHNHLKVQICLEQLAFARKSELPRFDQCIFDAFNGTLGCRFVNTQSIP
jgi:hypothetical protein